MIRRWRERRARIRLMQDMTSCILRDDHDRLDRMINEGRITRRDLVVHALSCCLYGLRCLGDAPKVGYVAQPVTSDGSPVSPIGQLVAAALNDDADMVDAHLNVIFSGGEDTDEAVHAADTVVHAAGSVLRRLISE